MTDQEYLPDNTPRRDVIDRTTDMLAMVQANREVITQGLDLAAQITDVYAESQRLNAKVEMVSQWSQVEMAKTAAKFYATREIMERVFDERHEALSAHYRTLDHALASGDRELIVAAMQQISSVVTSSPLEDIELFTKQFNDPSVNLLDF